MLILRISGRNNPLYYAVQDDDLERVSLLLKAGVDPEL